VATHLHTASAGKESAVLRITTCINTEATRLIIEGKLAGACVGELEKCWREIASTKSPESIRVELSSVTFVDAAGKQLLAGMHEQGTRFTAAGLLAKCLMEEIERSGAEKDNKDFEKSS
jgi:ABC-type transporter Mla MlaB component